ncbi:hypothetical protein D9M68_592870 [compost metagenome]
MLGDATGFAGHHVGVADRIKQRGLAVVDVTHDRDDRRTRQQLLIGIGHVEDAFLDVGFRNALDRMAEFAGDEFSHIGVDQIAGLHHLAFLHQVLDDVDGAFGHALRQFLNGDGLRQDDFARDLLAGFLHLAALELLLAATHGRQRTGALAAILVDGSGQRQLALATTVVGLRAGRNLGRLGTHDLAACRARARTRTTIVILFVVDLTAAQSAGRSRGRKSSCRFSRPCSLRAVVDATLSGSRCASCHGALFDNLFGLCFRLDSRAGRFFSGAACGLFLLLKETGFFLALAACFVLGADDRFFGIADLRFGESTAARIDLTGGKLVQNDTHTRTVGLIGFLARRVLLRLRGRAAGRLRLSRTLFDRACCGSRGDRRDRTLVLGAMEGAFLGFDHDRLGAATAHVLTHGPLRNPVGFQGQRLLACCAACLVVVVVGHSVPFLAIRAGCVSPDPVFQIVSNNVRDARLCW